MQTRVSPTRKLTDASHQNRLAARLRAMPSKRALALVKRVIVREPDIGLAIANRVLHDQKQLEELFIEGLHSSNESTSRHWIERLTSRIGVFRVLELVERESRKDPTIAAKALYWLGPLLKHDEKAKPILQRLRDEFIGRAPV